MKALRPVRRRILWTVLCGTFVLSGLTVTLQAQKVAYDSMAKRDPFISLLKQKQQKDQPPPIVPPPPLDKRPPGLAGLLISEVTVSGTASGPSSQLVILQGIDEMTYFARAGSKLFDGYLDELAGDQVVFIREQVDTRGQKRVSRVVKRMQTEER